MALTARTISIANSNDYKNMIDLLAIQHIRLDRNIEKIIGIYDEDNLVASGGTFANTLRSIAVKQEYTGTEVINRLMSELINEQYRKGNSHLFIYTKPASAKSFSYFGFKELVRVEKKAVLMETDDGGIEDYMKDLKEMKVEGKKITGIVMNGNPFTNGHQYLIEKAAEESDHVHVFVVWENRSYFPTEVRYRLIREGTAHLDNVTIHKGNDYIISSATFPTYFLKEEDSDVSVHAELDLRIFGHYIAKALGITHRYVGEETYCQTTASYNLEMKKHLPEYNVEVVEVSRLKAEDKQISASHVRSYLKEEEWEKIKKIVPKSTYDFLRSKEAEGIINNIRTSDFRH